ncbi:hypothetical protein [Gluconacetobacter diazotrophicus]|uniref:hypothetical protein n=1 Tax=Gluconacetobacter diazotrophicus TaxID=33996 RepID=UPI0012FF2765|nr:hypothetical protein [Gluconacetobacter diazotrophicus]
MTTITLNKYSLIKEKIEELVVENGGDSKKDYLPIENIVDIIADIKIYQRTIKSEGEVIYDEKRGCSLAHPLTRNIREAQRLLPPLYECLGLNIRARNKIKDITSLKENSYEDIKGLL